MKSKPHFDEAKAQYMQGLIYDEMSRVIAEEMDEYWDEVKFNPNKKDGVKIEHEGARELSHIEHRGRLREELIQTGAMVLRALHDLC